MAYNLNQNELVQDRISSSDNEEIGTVQCKHLGFLSIFKKLKRKITRFLFDNEGEPQFNQKTSNPECKKSFLNYPILTNV